MLESPAAGGHFDAACGACCYGCTKEVSRSGIGPSSWRCVAMLSEGLQRQHRESTIGREDYLGITPDLSITQIPSALSFWESLLCGYEIMPLGVPGLANTDKAGGHQSVPAAPLFR